MTIALNPDSSCNNRSGETRVAAADSNNNCKRTTLVDKRKKRTKRRAIMETGGGEKIRQIPEKPLKKEEGEKDVFNEMDEIVEIDEVAGSSNNSKRRKIEESKSMSVSPLLEEPQFVTRENLCRVVFHSMEKLFEKMADSDHAHQHVKPKYASGGKSRRHSKTASMNDLKDAAIACRLIPDNLNAHERERFAEIIGESNEERRKEGIIRYCFIRNRILHLWLQDVRQTLTFKFIMETFNFTECKMVSKIYCYLERFGFINFGFYKMGQNPPIRYITPRRKIAVIGAGISGIAAAQQLKRFGFDVVVLEGRDRIGGRIHTHRNPSRHVEAELGAMVITGLGNGNPMYVLSRQLNLKLYPIRARCPLYDTDGKPVAADIDQKVENAWNRLLDLTSTVSHELQIREVDKKQLTLGRAISEIMLLEDMTVKQERETELREVLAKQTKSISCLEERKEAQLEVVRAFQGFAAEMQLASAANGVREKELASESISPETHKKLFDAHNRLLKAEKNFKRIVSEGDEPEEVTENMIGDLDAPVEAFNEFEKKVLDWHIANLEFANATEIKNLSAAHWDQDDGYALSGRHLLVKGGYASVVKGLSCGLKINYNSAVTGIDYDDSAVRVHVVKTGDVGKKECINADAVLVTAPLGVLQSGSIVFSPPLPNWKRECINRVGFGNLNKVVLVFKEVFWEDGDMFGCLADDSNERGLGFFFWNLAPVNGNTPSPVLLGLIAGKAANDCDNFLTDEEVVEKAMAKLRGIYGEKTLEPEETLVTHWSQEEFTRGAYSYVAENASGYDYDLLAKSVSVDEDKPPTVFFAGEHTCRNYPATVHGAYLTGVREAGKIVDTFFGKDCSIYDYHPADFHRSASGVPDSLGFTNSIGHSASAFRPPGATPPLPTSSKSARQPQANEHNHNRPPLLEGAADDSSGLSSGPCTS
eukprot:Nk52_evm1s280 gene=Nk52_evmTU1s280